MESRISAVGVLDKAMSILFALEGEPRSLSDLVDATGISRATAHRLATALEAHGVVRRDDDGRFALGLGLLALGQAAAASVPLRALARPSLEVLRERTGESVQLYVRDGDVRVCVDALESPHGLRTIVPVGAALPLGVGSAGRILADGWPHGRRMPRWVESVEERERGVASVSAPVRDQSGRVLAAVSVSGPLERTTRSPGRKYGTAVAGAAADVEQRSTVLS